LSNFEEQLSKFNEQMSKLSEDGPDGRFGQRASHVADLNELCLWLAHTGFTVEAFATIQLMRKHSMHGVGISRGALNQTASRLIQDAVRSREYRSQLKAGASLRALSRLTSGWADHEQVKAACKIIGWMGEWKLSPSPSLVASVMRYLALVGEARQCLKVLSLMERAGYRLRGRDYGIVQSALCAKRRYKSVRELHSRLKAAKVPLCGANILFAALASVSVQDAMRIVSESSPEHRVYAFAGVFEACRRLRTDCDEVLTVYTQMSEMEVTPCTPKAEIVYAALINCFCSAAESARCREWDFAKAAVQDAPVETGECSLLFLKHCARVGDAQAAHEVREAVGARLNSKRNEKERNEKRRKSLWADEADTLVRAARVSALGAYRS